jgi:Uma2 family endonuclease
MSTLAIPSPEVREQRVTMRNVSWETYEGLLAANASASSPRITYDHGELEIMSPSFKHEDLNEFLAAVVDIVAEEWGIEFRRLGSTTFRRRDLQRGAEPDCCFYIQRVEDIRGIQEMDLLVHPAPDLVIEIEITNPALEKLPIWARFGVPEVWLAGAEGVRILRLAAGEYRPQEESEALPLLTAAVLSEFLQRSSELKTLAWRRMVREWARSAG